MIERTTMAFLGGFAPLKEYKKRNECYCNQNLKREGLVENLKKKLLF